MCGSLRSCPSEDGDKEGVEGELALRLVTMAKLLRDEWEQGNYCPQLEIKTKQKIQLDEKAKLRLGMVACAFSSRPTWST